MLLLYSVVFFFGVLLFYGDKICEYDRCGSCVVTYVESIHLWNYSESFCLYMHIQPNDKIRTYHFPIISGKFIWKKPIFIRTFSEY